MRTQIRRVVALATAVPVLALSIGAGGRAVQAALPDEAAQTSQLAEAPPGLASQQASEIWLNTLEKTIDRKPMKKSLPTRKYFARRRVCVSPMETSYI